MMRNRQARMLVWLSCLLAAPIQGALGADEASKTSPTVIPPWQRYLRGEDARKAAEQQKQLQRLQEDGQFDEALVVAEALAKLRKTAQGADHWQAVNARWTAEALRRVLRQSDEARKEYAGISVLLRQIQALDRKERHKEAQSLDEKLLAIRRRVLGENHPFTAYSYNNLAINQKAQGKYVEAEDNYRKSLAIKRQLLGEEHPDTADGYHNLANLQNTQSKYVEAEDNYRKALAIKHRVLGEEHLSTAKTYNSLASNFNSQRKYKEAEDYYRKALTIRRKLLGEDHPDIAAGYRSLARNQNAQGKKNEAEESLVKARISDRRRRGEANEDTAKDYYFLATNQDEQGKYVEAEQNARNALAIGKKVLGEDNIKTASIYKLLAQIQREQGKYAEAEGNYHKALAINRKVVGEEHPSTAGVYNHLAQNQVAQGSYAAAEKNARHALAICRKVLGEQHSNTAASLAVLAQVLNAQRKHKEAEDANRMALAIDHKVRGEEHPETGISYNNLAVSLRFQGKYAEAEEGFRRALAIFRKVRGEEHLDTIVGSHNLAYTQFLQGDYSEAEKTFRQVLATARLVLGEEHPLTVSTYRSLADNQRARGDYQEAERLGLQAAQSFARNRLHVAADGLTRATSTSELSPLPPLVAVLARNGKAEDAWQRFEEGLARGTWDDLSARLRRPAAEQAKQGELVNRLHRLDQLLEKTPMPDADKAEREKHRAELLSQRRQVQDELDAFRRTLEKTYGPVAGQILNRRQVQSALPTDTALIGWLDIRGRTKAADPNGEHWAVLLRSSGPPLWIRLPGSGPQGAWTDEDTRLPDELQTALWSPRGRWQPLAQRLRQQRLQPLAKHLEGVRRLIVLPSPALDGVPVESFAESYTVSYAHSGTIYAHLHKQPKLTSQGLLALADPVFERSADAERRRKERLLISTRGEDTWPALPGTRIEVEALRRLFAEPSAKLLTDSDASEQNLYALAQSGELGKYRYLHLATHGEVDDHMPLRSAVILSRDRLPDPGKQLEAGLPVHDGQLTAEEVLRQWHLNSELVTLSACQTALGKYEKSEGHVGFAQALILSGSRAVCLSLWKVDDAATALLMERFYQNLLGKREGLTQPLGKAAALAEAKAWLRGLSRQEAVQRAALLSKGVARGKGRKELPPLTTPETPVNVKEDRPYAHPYYWAAFVLIGDAD